LRSEFLLFSPPALGEEEIAEVMDTLRSGWITTGPKVERFEREFCAFVGAQAALAVNSGTAALHLALASLGIGPGDAVITTVMTFCSTVHVIEHVGACPVLVDLDPETLNLDPAAIRPAIEKFRSHNPDGRIRAIIPVHLYGNPCALEPILRMAQEEEWFVIEDAAHALPAKYRGRMIGAAPTAGFPGPQAQLTCFSFYATKNITTAEGGMLTGPPAILEKARILSLHGMSRDAWKRYSADSAWQYDVVAAGFKYNLSDIAAALGLVQLKKLSLFWERRRAVVRRYQEAFSTLEEVQTPAENPEIQPAWHLYALRLNLERLQISRNRFLEELKKRNIGASVHFIPVHLLRYYRDKFGYRPEDFPVAYREYQRLLSLPLYPLLNEKDVEDVIAAVQQIVHKYRKRCI
jgi:dTDP-4-amino-4,6-dideoxygalactose transaminase